ncbi:MAG: HdeD family acid-resistance protein [Candidatus Manganitrophus sp.]|nr:MAG: HdeD family acid-resistance protein [Candidatus Manganitrophus sp.]
MFNLLTRNWWLLIVRGILAILFGVLAFIRPEITLATVVLFFGAYVFVDGIFSIIFAIGGWDYIDDYWLLLLQGIVGIGIGLLTFWAPGITALSLVLYIAAWSLVVGVLQIVGAVRLRREIEGEWWLVLSGVVSVLFAGILMWNPVAGAIGLLWAIAIYAIIYGVIQIVLGFRVHGLRGQVRRAEA